MDGEITAILNEICFLKECLGCVFIQKAKIIAFLQFSEWVQTLTSLRKYSYVVCRSTIKYMWHICWTSSIQTLAYNTVLRQVYRHISILYHSLLNTWKTVWHQTSCTVYPKVQQLNPEEAQFYPHEVELPSPKHFKSHLWHAFSAAPASTVNTHMYMMVVHEVK